MLDPILFRKKIITDDIILKIINFIINNEDEILVDYLIEDYKTNTVVSSEATLLYSGSSFENQTTILASISKWANDYKSLINKLNTTYADHLTKKHGLGSFNLPTEVMEYNENKINKQLMGFIPISVERPKPKPIYIYSGSNPSDVGFDAQNLPDILYKDKSLIKKANLWLKKLGFNFALDIKRLSNSDIFEIRFVDYSRNNLQKKN